MSKSQNSLPHIHWFRSAAPYINAHRGKTFVICFTGEAVQSTEFSAMVNDIALLHSLGIRLVLVHGARPQIDQRLNEHGLVPQYADDLRITDDAALPLIKQAIGETRLEIEARLSMGLINTPMAGSQLRTASGNYVIAKPYGVRNGIDFCHTGEIRRIDHEAISNLLDNGYIVLLSPLGYSSTGEVFNLRYEDIAQATAASLCADKLVLLLEDHALHKNRQPLRQLTLKEVQQLVSQAKQDVRTQYYLQLASQACQAGVARVHLLNRKQDGVMLQEFFTRDGVGTLVTNEKYEELRNASIQDVGGILELIQPLEADGILVRRSREQLELEINRFTVIERDGMIIGCAALYPYIEEKMGELACIVVHADYAGAERGKALFMALESHAQQLGLKQLFALTTHTAHWFREHGFVPTDIQALPMKKRALYNYQRNSKVLLKTL
ncbi:MAG: amino-acid N-acetyltransferase [Gammaproteobacteria bacterium]|nr:amino-acid N-acetyltransferase [Gammaproteobacteria bacterium]